MKKLFLLVVAVAMIGMYSCTKDNNGNGPGSETETGVAGFGDRVAEDVEVGEKFLLPEGVEIVGGIQGITPMYANLKSTSDDPLTYDEIDEMYGLGGQFITLVMQFVNGNDDPTEVLFKPGLIFEIVDGLGYDITEFQRGMILTQMLVNLDGGETKTVALNLFCFNKGLNGSAFSVEYKAVGVTENELMLDLLFYVNNERYDWLGDTNDVLLGEISMGQLTNEEAAILIANIQQLIWWITDHTHPDALTKEEVLSKLNELVGSHT
ncbi:hypothetical protein [Saccharicrinis aurantiacus]|uniref:hypothetical protein n=1 Tax=Saccharicrinis aurantiacus TaxID=1849719 RepID=UPI00095018AA|nr:hypothetical protein [Saccharicrinis aurantiacus]